MKTALVTSVLGSAAFLRKNVSEGVHVCQFGISPIYVTVKDLKYWFLPEGYNSFLLSSMWMFGEFPMERIILCNTARDAVDILMKKGYEEVIVQSMKGMENEGL
jgi:hypothetical protein